MNQSGASPVNVPTANPATPYVNSVRTDVTNMYNRWTLIEDAVIGEDAIKRAGTKYLPMPNPTDLSQENQMRYNVFKQRAVWYAATGRTLRGLVGQVLAKEPEVELPKLLEGWDWNVNGKGATATQFCKIILNEIIATGRGGLMADFPTKSDGTEVTMADVSNGVRPFFRFFRAKQIINWRESVVDGVGTVVMVVLEDENEVPNGEFGSIKLKIYRVLTLEGLEAGQERYVRSRVFEAQSTGDFKVTSDVIMTDSTGKPLNKLPFVFIGAEENSPNIGPAPLEDLARLNVSHYGDAADAQDSSHMVGQPTPVFAGLTEEWVKNVFKGQINLGSRAAVFLPSGASAELLCATENMLPMQLMERKEKQMVALGARLIQDKSVQQTATEYSLESTADLSVLGAVAHNVNSALKQLFPVIYAFLTSEPLDDADCFEINTDFDASRMSFQERAQLMAEWQAGAIDYEEMRSNLKQTGVAFKDDAEVQENVAQELSSMNPQDPYADPNQPPAPGTKPAKKTTKKSAPAAK